MKYNKFKFGDKVLVRGQSLKRVFEVQHCFRDVYSLKGWRGGRLAEKDLTAYSATSKPLEGIIKKPIKKPVKAKFKKGDKVYVGAAQQSNTVERSRYSKTQSMWVYTMQYSGERFGEIILRAAADRKFQTGQLVCTKNEDGQACEPRMVLDHLTDGGYRVINLITGDFAAYKEDGLKFFGEQAAFYLHDRNITLKNYKADADKFRKLKDAAEILSEFIPRREVGHHPMVGMMPPPWFMGGGMF